MEHARTRIRRSISTGFLPPPPTTLDHRRYLRRIFGWLRAPPLSLTLAPFLSLSHSRRVNHLCNVIRFNARTLSEFNREGNRVARFENLLFFPPFLFLLLLLLFFLNAI